MALLLFGVMENISNQSRRLPQRQPGMAVQDKKPVSESEYLLESFNALRTDVHSQLAALSKQVSEISIYVVERKVLEKALDLSAEMKALAAEMRAFEKRFLALERLHDLPVRLDTMNGRIDALETARKTDAAVHSGKKSVGDRVIAITAYAGALLGIILAIKEIWGK